MAKGAKHSPPGEGVEALHEVEGGKPELGASCRCGVDEVSDYLGSMEGAALGAEAEGSIAQEARLESRGPEHNGALGPDPVDDLQDRDRSLVLGPSAARRLWDHGHIGVQPLRGPPAVVLDEGEEASNGCKPPWGHGLPRGQGDTGHPGGGGLSHSTQCGTDPVFGPWGRGPGRGW